MTPEAGDYLDKAREELTEARVILGLGLAKTAARGAYYAAFHAAQALLVARTGRIAKTHTGSAPHSRNCCGRLRSSTASC